MGIYFQDYLCNMTHLIREITLLEKNLQLNFSNQSRQIQPYHYFFKNLFHTFKEQTYSRYFFRDIEFFIQVYIRNLAFHLDSCNEYMSSVHLILNQKCLCKKYHQFLQCPSFSHLADENTDSYFEILCRFFRNIPLLYLIFFGCI